MKALFLILCLLFNGFAEQDRQVLMDSISQYAIRIGSGPNKIYTFVDPLCPKSQLFVGMITERQDLQEKNSYYIFLYRLRKFDSDAHIQYIAQSNDPLNALKEIMLDEDYSGLETFVARPQTLSKIKKVAKIAEEMQIKRRPYLLIFDEGSQHCRVSEGTAPCLEDKDFE